MGEGVRKRKVLPENLVVPDAVYQRLVRILVRSVLDEERREREGNRRLPAEQSSSYVPENMSGQKVVGPGQ